MNLQALMLPSLLSMCICLPVRAQELVITDEIPGDFVDISSTGVALGLGGEALSEITSGFNLQDTLFAGDGTGRMCISSNGAVGFLGCGDSTGAFFVNGQLPSTALFGGAHGMPQALAIYWDDLDWQTGDVYVQTMGDPGERVLVVQWHNRPHSPGDAELDGNEATFQLQIFEDAVPGHAQFIYQDTEFLNTGWDGGASATIGYQSGGIMSDVQWSYNVPCAVQNGTVLTLVECMGCLPAGDLNCDGVIDASDLSQLLGAWGPCMGPCAPGDPVPGCGPDLSGDGEVGPADLAALLGQWGPCP